MPACFHSFRSQPLGFYHAFFSKWPNFTNDVVFPANYVISQLFRSKSNCQGGPVLELVDLSSQSLCGPIMPCLVLFKYSLCIKKVDVLDQIDLVIRGCSPGREYPQRSRPFESPMKLLPRWCLHARPFLSAARARLQ